MTGCNENNVNYMNVFNMCAQRERERDRQTDRQMASILFTENTVDYKQPEHNQRP